MRSMSALILLTFAAVLALAVPAGARVSAAGAADDRNAHGCWYYGDEGFQGARAKIVAGGDLASLGEDFNDRISSLTCHPLCTLVAYDGENRTGARKSFRGDVRSLGEAWNDKISSMTVTCRRRIRS